VALIQELNARKESSEPRLTNFSLVFLETRS